MEKPSNLRGSNGGVGEDDGHEEKQPLRPGRGLETERPAAHAHAAEQEASRRGRLRRNYARTALVLCLLTLSAGVLLLQLWRAVSSPESLFDVELPKEEDDDKGLLYSS